MASARKLYCRTTIFEERLSMTLVVHLLQNQVEKKKIILKKYLCFLQNIHYLQKKIILYGKKIYFDFFFTEKAFYTENEKKYIYLI